MRRRPGGWREADAKFGVPATRPSTVNQEAFDEAVWAVTAATHTLLDGLVTKAPPRDREVEATKARVRAAERYGARATAAG